MDENDIRAIAAEVWKTASRYTDDDPPSLLFFQPERNAAALGTLAETRFLGNWAMLISFNSLAVPFMTLEDAVDIVAHEFGHVVAGPYADHGADWKLFGPILGYRPSPYRDIEDYSLYAKTLIER